MCLLAITSPAGKSLAYPRASCWDGRCLFQLSHGFSGVSKSAPMWFYGSPQNRGRSAPSRSSLPLAVSHLSLSRGLWPLGTLLLPVARASTHSPLADASLLTPTHGSLTKSTGQPVPTLFPDFFPAGCYSLTSVSSLPQPWMHASEWPCFLFLLSCSVIRRRM